MKILLIDNYDSFTFNLYHYISSLNTKVDVIRNDKINSIQIKKKKYDKIVISPGPGNPNQSGNCVNILKSLHKELPFLGVCLGHQIIGQVFGSKIVQAKKLMHGKTSKIKSKKICLRCWNTNQLSMPMICHKCYGQSTQSLSWRKMSSIL